MIFRSAPLFLLPLLLLSAPAHAVVTVLVEEVDNGEGGTDVVATATGSIDSNGFGGSTATDGDIDLANDIFIVGTTSSDQVNVELRDIGQVTGGIWDGSTSVGSRNPSNSDYRFPTDNFFTGNTKYNLGVSDDKVYLSEPLISDVLSNAFGDIGTIRSTWANQSFPDLGIAYNSTWTIEWDGGGENKTLTYTAVPEPSQYGLLFGLAAAFAAVGLRRRRRAGGKS